MKQGRLSFAICLLFIVVLAACAKKQFSDADHASGTLSKNSGSNVRYKDTVFSSVNKPIQDFVYRVVRNNLDSTQFDNLKLTVYEPAGDTLSLRPAVIFIHGGAFTSGSYDIPNQDSVCTSLALRGYVAITIGYRLGINLLGANNMNDSIDRFYQTVYKAVQDARAAIRCVRKEGHNVRIDTNKIFIGGASAGAGTALVAAYLDQHEIPDTFWQRPGLGPLDGTDPNYDYPNHSTAVNGVVNVEGGMTDTSYIEPGDAPIISFYGNQDTLRTYNGTWIYEIKYPFYGGLSIHRRAGNVDVHNILVPFYQGGHGISLSSQSINPETGKPFIQQTITMFCDFLWYHL